MRIGSDFQTLYREEENSQCSSAIYYKLKWFKNCIKYIGNIGENVLGLTPEKSFLPATFFISLPTGKISDSPGSDKNKGR